MRTDYRTGVTDDPELRARIEAQVAARRARRASPTPAANGDEPDTDVGSGDEPTGSRSLAPSRPWNRPSGATERPPAAGPGEPAGPGLAGPGGLGPQRPWLNREHDVDETETTYEDDSAAEPDVAPAKGALRPARPWSARRSSEKAAAPSAPTPSNPDTVLRDLAADLTPAEQTRLDPLSEAPDGPVADEPPQTELTTDEPSMVDSADGAEAAAEVETYPWERREAVDLDLHGAPTWDPSMYPPEPDAPAPTARRAFR
ncbi:MAG: hypothetical protein QOC66_2568, partial [Pseudonocardiales bacterium]|nr:hypothetical protein [Pseudonocardiales bacterium]